VLTDISLTGDLNVTTGVGGVTGGVSQATNALLIIGGASTFTADTKTAQLATLTNASNRFVGALSFKTANGGTWSNVSVVSQSTLQMGLTEVTGNLNLSVTSGDITQVGPLHVMGTTTIVATAGSVLLDDADNSFGGRVSVDTPQDLKLTSSGALSMGVVRVGKTTDLQSHGIVDMGTSSVYTGKLKVTSGGFEIMQSGPLKSGGNEEFDAGTAKIELFNPGNLWLGALLYKGGIIMINHPQLLNAVNSGVLMVRAEINYAASPSKITTLVVQQSSTTTSPPSQTDIVAASTSTVRADVTVSINRAPVSGQTGLIQVQVAPELAASSKGFSFELDPHAVAGHAPDTKVQIVQVDGKPLPSWLSFDAATKTFTASEVPPGAFPLQVKISVGNTESIMMIQEQGQK
jgi:hypothetical protein